MAQNFPPIVQLRLADRPVAPPQPRAPSKRPFFLKGPVPLSWLERAARLPGRSLVVAVIVWFLAGLNRTGTVRVTSQWTERFGLDRHALYRALRWLEAEGLVTVKRRPGSCPEVTVIGWGRASSADEGRTPASRVRE